MLALLLPCIASVSADDGWKFESAYPPQYIAQRLSSGETITIDGNLDDPAWTSVAWTDKPFEDIAAPAFPHLTPPEAYQTRVKVRWDASFVYMAAEVNEPLIWGNVTGHNEDLTNGKAPWWNNDFEVFIDVAGSTHYYKEFEMNVRNATYDVMWRVPDGGMNSSGVPCNNSVATEWCHNSTYHKGEAWTLAGEGGMKTATGHPSALTPFDTPKWTVEIRFPLSAGETHGGVLDSDPKHDYAKFNPNSGNRFWWVNFARAEHPLETISASPLSIDFFTDDYSAMCAEVQKQYPSLLGTGPWACYWEFVWQNAGRTQYMHNPEMWGVVQFEDGKSEVCRTPMWPARYVGFMVHRAEIAFFKARGRYATVVAELMEGTYCSDANECSLSVLSSVASTYKDVFKVAVVVPEGNVCANYAAKTVSGAPCFVVNVTTTDPGTKQRSTVSIASDRYTTETTEAECL